MVSRPQLLALGLGDPALRWGVRHGALHRVHQGVYAVGYVADTLESRWMAAVLACGPNAALSHFDAAALWKIHDAPGPRVHVLTRSNRRGDGLWVHRARRLHPDDVTTERGIPVTSVARTLVDMTDVVGADRLLRAMREAEFLRLLDHDALSAAVERGRGRRNLRVLTTALAQHRPGQVVREELEHRFLELIRKAEISSAGDERQSQDELDGRAAHGRVTDFERDRERDAALSASGLRPARFTWKRVTKAGDEVIADLIAMLGQGGGAYAARTAAMKRSSLSGSRS